MTNYLIGAVCGVALASNVYLAGWGAAPKLHNAAESAECEACVADAKVVLMDVAATAPATTAAAGVDVKNTKCLVMPADDVGTVSVTYSGKTYHFCCKDCVADFNKDPAKYVKGFEADPSKFGVKK